MKRVRIFIIVMLIAYFPHMLGMDPDPEASSSSSPNSSSSPPTKKSYPYKGHFSRVTSIRRSPSSYPSEWQHPARVVVDKDQVTQEQAGAQVRYGKSRISPRGTQWVSVATRFVRIPTTTDKLVSTITGWAPKDSITDATNHTSPYNIGVITSMWCTPQEDAQYHLSLASQVTIIAEEEDTFFVTLPNGTHGHIAKDHMAALCDLENLSEEEKRNHILATAQQFSGYDFTWGACSPRHPNIPLEDTKSPETLRGVDCSGLTSLCYASCGITLSPLARTQWLDAHVIESEELRPGDLVFITRPDKFEEDHYIGHVMIYLGLKEGHRYLCDAYGPSNEVRVMRDTGCWNGTFDISQLPNRAIFKFPDQVLPGDTIEYQVFYGSYFGTAQKTYREIYGVEDKSSVPWSSLDSEPEDDHA